VSVPESTPARCGLVERSARGVMVTCDKPKGHDGMHSGPRAQGERFSWSDLYAKYVARGRVSP
jgi:hypothetical protein